MVHSLTYLFYKLYCKAIEMLCRLRTRTNLQDPSKILLDHYTDLQKKAASAVRPAASTSGEITKLAVLIPFRDRWELTSKAIASVLKQEVPGLDLRLFLLDNASSEERTMSGIQALVSQYPDQIHHIECPYEFNFSRLINDGVQQSAGYPWILLLNNDVEITGKHDLMRLLGFARSQENLGVAGVSLEFPDGRLQHLFVAPGVKIVAAHPLKGLRPGNWDWFAAPRPVPAVTGAAMLFSRKTFEMTGGFDNDLPTVGQDVDFCLNTQQKGLVNWVVPDVCWTHHEGASRGHAIDPLQVRRMYEKWGDYLVNNPYYTRKFSRWSEQPALTIGEGAYPWERLLLKS